MKTLISSAVLAAYTAGQAVLPDRVRCRLSEAWAQRQHDRAAKRTLQAHIRPSDVFLVAHAKSGNNWLAYMLAVLAHKDTNGRINLKNIGAYVPFLHSYNLGEIAESQHLPDPRVLRSELPVHPELYPKVLYLVRDPRAVLVSYYHTCRVLTGDAQTTPREFVNEYLAHGCIRRVGRQIRWDRHVLPWARRAQRDDRVMIVRYEDMIADRRAVLERAAQFAGIAYGRQDLAVAVDRSSFEAMRRSEEENGVALYTEEQGRRGRFIRRGKTDGWRDEFPRDVIAEIEKEFAPAMKAVGYV
jgi:hypothetical protein